MQFSKKIKFLAVFLALAMLFTIPAGAINWNGSSTGGSGGGSVTDSSGKYSVQDTDTTVAGYRFSRIDYYGNKINGPIDMLRSKYSSYRLAQNSYRFTTKYNKIELRSRMNSNISWSTSKTNTNVINDSGRFGTNVFLPTNPSGMGSFMTNGTYLAAVCRALGISNGAAGLQNGDKILVEPLFVCKLRGTVHTLTVSEIAMYGKDMFGKNSNGGSSASSGAWGFISKYTNQVWPNSLYSNDSKFWTAASATSSRLTFGTILDKGYGVGFAYNDTTSPKQPVDVKPTGVRFYTSSNCAAGTQVPANRLTEGMTVYAKLYFSNASSIAADAKVKAYDNAHNKWIVNNVSVHIAANGLYTVIDPNPFVINKDLGVDGAGAKVDTYTYDKNTIVFDTKIYFDKSSGKNPNGYESNAGDDSKVWKYHYEPKQPTATHAVTDVDYNDDSLISKALNNRTVYSGELLRGNVTYKAQSTWKMTTLDSSNYYLGSSLLQKIVDGSGALRAVNASWSRQTAEFRPKYTTANHTGTMTAHSRAGEKTFAKAVGAKIDNQTASEFANHVLSSQTYYPNKTESGITTNWDNTARTLTVNGSMTGHTSRYKFNIPVTGGDQFKITATYISGSYTGKGNTSLCFDVHQTQSGGDDGWGRAWVDINPSKVYSEKTVTRILTAKADGDGIETWIWREASPSTFNNLKIKFTIEKIKGYGYGSNTTVFTVMPTDLEIKSADLYYASNNLKVDPNDTLAPGTKIYAKTVVANNTNTAVPVALSMAVAPAMDIDYDYSILSHGAANDESICQVENPMYLMGNKIYSMVLNRKTTLEFKSVVFEVSAKTQKYMRVKSSVYINGLANNTEYEYNGNNNVVSHDYNISTPFEPTLVQANSQYRRGIEVITSFNIQSNAEVDYGTTQNIADYGKLSATFNIYDNAEMTGDPIYTGTCDYAVRAVGETLVWFKWKVPMDAPDKLYGRMICDADNNYSCSNYVNLAGNSKSVDAIFNIVMPEVVSTPDTTFAKAVPSWYEDGKQGNNEATESGLDYYGTISGDYKTLKINQQRLFRNKHFYQADSAQNLSVDVDQTWDNTNRILSLNGRADHCFGKSPTNCTFNFDVKKGEKYRIKATYVSGNIVSNNNHTNVLAALVFEVNQYQIGENRQNADVYFPNFDGHSNTVTVDLDIKSDDSRIATWFWINNDAANGQMETLTFNNYKIKIEIERVTATNEAYPNTLSWAYYANEDSGLVLKTDTATLRGSSVDLIPDGARSARIGANDEWNIKSGYGYKIITEFKKNTSSTAVQSGYMVFPEFLNRTATATKKDQKDHLLGYYTNTNSIRTGFQAVNGKYPSCGGIYGTYSTLEKGVAGNLILPNNESSKSATHFIPIWYPIGKYQTTCYVADAWTPAGMLSYTMKSTKLQVNGNMYDDYVVSQKK